MNEKNNREQIIQDYFLINLNKSERYIMEKFKRLKFVNLRLVLIQNLPKDFLKYNANFLKSIQFFGYYGKVKDIKVINKSHSKNSVQISILFQKKWSALLAYKALQYLSINNVKLKVTFGQDIMCKNLLNKFCCSNKLCQFYHFQYYNDSPYQSFQDSYYTHLKEYCDIKSNYQFNSMKNITKKNNLYCLLPTIEQIQQSENYSLSQSTLLQIKLSKIQYHQFFFTNYQFQKNYRFLIKGIILFKKLIDDLFQNSMITITMKKQFNLKFKNYNIQHQKYMTIFGSAFQFFQELSQKDYSQKKIQSKFELVIEEDNLKFFLC